jgi:hypothetical protein
MTSLVDEFRLEARGRDSNLRPALRRLQGWSFGLSFIDPAVTSDAVVHAVLAQLREWGVEHSLDPARGPFWLLSAKLIPVGRGSTVSDWEFLGEFLRAVRVPTDAIERGSARVARVHANETQLWVWHKADEKENG